MFQCNDRISDVYSGMLRDSVAQRNVCERRQWLVARAGPTTLDISASRAIVSNLSLDTVGDRFRMLGRDATAGYVPESQRQVDATSRGAGPPLCIANEHRENSAVVPASEAS